MNLSPISENFNIYGDTIFTESGIVRGKVVFQGTNTYGVVKVITWLNNQGQEVRKDYYNQYGWRYMSEDFNNGKIISRTYYSYSQKVIIMENLTTNAVQFMNKEELYPNYETLVVDYLIKKCDLNQIIKNVIKKNQDSLLYQNIAIKIKNIEATVLSDSKWLEFIINQIISNSIKYHGESDCLISFNVIQNKNHISLEILDNGIGIKDSELPYVFDKSFTGENGRLVSSATGMGLYIVKNLCHKLGHQIAIESKQGKYTKVIIDFNNEDYYKVVR